MFCLLLLLQPFLGKGSLYCRVCPAATRDCCPKPVWRRQTLQLMGPRAFPWAFMVLLRRWKDLEHLFHLPSWIWNSSIKYFQSYKFAFPVFSHWVWPQRSTKPAWLSTLMVTWSFGLSVQNRRTFSLKFNKCAILCIYVLLLWGLACLLGLQVDILFYCWLFLRKFPLYNLVVTVGSFILFLGRDTKFHTVILLLCYIFSYFNL